MKVFRVQERDRERRFLDLDGLLDLERFSERDRLRLLDLERRGERDFRGDRVLERRRLRSREGERRLGERERRRRGERDRRLAFPLGLASSARSRVDQIDKLCNLRAA